MRCPVCLAVLDLLLHINKDNIGQTVEAQVMIIVKISTDYIQIRRRLPQISMQTTADYHRL